MSTLREDSIEIVALLSANYGDTDSRYGRLVPDDVWQKLFDEKLVELHGDLTGEYTTVTTQRGCDVLTKRIEKLVACHCEYCGAIAWTESAYGRLTHKHACPDRAEPWCQSHVTGCHPNVMEAR